MSSAKRPAAAPPGPALHKNSSKADLDSFLKKMGATEPNPYSVEEIFGAVDGAMWDDVRYMRWGGWGWVGGCPAEFPSSLAAPG